ncbi:MAG: ATP-binding protein [Leptolyngbyaceae cyanobacterium bins.302]|nr:ATP-binding protein [Leptolyngbyaceae cyanobacterium bins.302]
MVDLTLLNHIPDLVCLLDAELCFIHVNSNWQHDLGWTLVQLEGRSWFEWAHPDTVDHDRSTLQHQLKSTQTLSLTNRYRHYDGSYRWLSWSGANQDGCLYLTARDITTQQEEIQALKTERQSLYSLLDQLPSFLYLQPQNHGVGFYNQRFREIFGEPGDRHCYEVIAGLQQPCPQCPTFRVFDTNAPQLWEYHDAKSDRFYQIYDYPFVALNGEPMVVEMGLDITAQKKAEAELRQAHNELEQRVAERTARLTQATKKLQQRDLELTEKNEQLEQALIQLKSTQSQLVQTEKISSLGQLVAGIAHEVNNPISFISGNLHHALEYSGDLINLIRLYQNLIPNPPNQIQQEAEKIELDYVLEDLPKLLSSMRVGIDRIRDIMQSLRNFSRVDKNGAAPADLLGGIDTTLMILQHRLKAKPERPEIKVIKHWQNLPLIECSLGQLNQVFMNLISNAIDALDDAYAQGQQPQPQILISTDVMNEHRVKIAIEDNGIGIPENVRTQVFEPFFTTKPVGKGTGLGLSISYQIVTEMHRGSLTCHSGVPSGTQFVIQLPVCQSSESVCQSMFRSP